MTRPHQRAAITAQARHVADAQIGLSALLLASCPGPHRYVQHRDGRPPWCRACGYTAAGDPVESRPHPTSAATASTPPAPCLAKVGDREAKRG